VYSVIALIHNTGSGLVLDVVCSSDLMSAILICGLLEVVSGISAVVSGCQ